MSNNIPIKNELVLSKINKPRLAACYFRQRLFNKLDQLIQHPIIWISGPAGSGKTSLASSYIEDRELNVLWYQIDTRDNDLATFFYHMGLAGKQVAPQCPPLPALTLEYMAGLSTFYRNYFEELYSRLKTPFVLVLDNFQELPSDSPFHSMLNDALSVLPETGNVFILSRSEPPANLARLQANQSMALLKWEDMQLTSEETCGIAKLNTQHKFNKNDCLHLLDISRGWAAGLVLLLNQSALSDEPLKMTQANSHQDIFDYFSGEISSKASQSERNFLLQSAFLPQMTVENTQQLTNQPQAKQILEDLSRRNYFIFKLQQAQLSYQYHPLFQAFLQATAEQTYSAEQLYEIRSRAAALLIESHHFAHAAELLQAAKNWRSLIELIMYHARSLIARGRHQTLQAWISSIPAEYTKDNAWLYYWLGMCQLAFQPVDARSQFVKAFDLFKLSKDQTGMALSWASIAESVFIAWDEFIIMDPWLDQFEKTFGDNPQFANVEIEVQVISSILIALLFRRPELKRLAPWVERAERLINQISDHHLRLLLSHKLLFYYAWMGNPAAMKHTMDTLHHQIDLQKISPLYLIYWHIFENMHGYSVGNAENWRKAIENGLQVSNASGVHVLDDLTFAQSVWCNLAENDMSEVAYYLEKLAGVIKPDAHLAQGQYLYLSSLVSLQQEDVNRALTISRLGLMEVEQSGVPFAQALTRIAYCHALFESGNQQEAIEQLAIAREETGDMHSELLEYQLLTVESYFAFKQQDTATGLQQLSKAMATGRSSGLMNFPGWRESVMTELCVIALQHNIETDYVQHLINTRHLMPQKPPLELDNWPWPVKIYTLGRFSLLIDDQLQTFPGKSSHRPLEFLKALIAFGGRNVSQEKLIEALWPEAAGDAAMKSLYTTLHRLRKLLIHEQALTIKDGQITLNARYVWIDVWSLERMLGDLDQLLKNTNADPVAIEALTDNIEKYYSGSFFESEPDQPWLMPHQEKLRARSLRLLLKLGCFWSAHSQWEKALSAYEKGLEIDPLAEIFYQHLMRDYATQGHTAEALATYERCRKVLCTVLNIMPCSETLALYQQIQS